MFGIAHHSFAGAATKVLTANDFLSIVADDYSVVHPSQVVSGSLVHRDVFSFCSRVLGNHSLVYKNSEIKESKSSLIQSLAGIAFLNYNKKVCTSHPLV